MSEYPREDMHLAVCLSDGTRISGLINIAGRSIREVLEDEGPDLVLYDALGGEGMPLKTAFIGKDHILWIASGGETKPGVESVVPRRVKLTLSNGQAITGRIDISGFDRLSDYFHACRQQFYEVLEASLVDKTHEVLYVGIAQVLWKEPVD